ANKTALQMAEKGWADERRGRCGSHAGRYLRPCLDAHDPAVRDAAQEWRAGAPAPLRSVGDGVAHYDPARRAGPAVAERARGCDAAGPRATESRGQGDGRARAADARAQAG